MKIYQEYTELRWSQLVEKHPLPWANWNSTKLLDANNKEIIINDCIPFLFAFAFEKYIEVQL